MSGVSEPLLRKKATRLLARRAYSRAEMRLKLLNFADSAKVEAVLERLDDLKLLNDAEYAYNFAFYRVTRQGWGPEKIIHSLRRHKVQESDINNALVRLRVEIGEDYGLSDYLRRYSAKRDLPNDPKGVRNLVKHLLRRGFRHSSILDALKRVLPADIV